MLRVAGSVAMLLLLLAFVPAGTLRSAFAQASLSAFAIASAIHFVGHLVAALKWRMLMGPGARLPATTAFRAHFSGLAGNFTPLGIVGGDLVRAGVAIGGGVSPGDVMVTGVVDRVVDTAALLALLFVGVLWVGGRSGAGATVLWGGLALLVIGLTLSAMAFTWLRRTQSPGIAGIRDAAESVVRQPGLIARALLLSILVQAAFVAASAYIGADVGVECSFAAWLVAWPASKIIAYLPISIAGIGIRESALIALLRPFGGAPAAVMTASLLWQGVIIGGSLFGWLGWSLLPGLMARVPHRSRLS